MLPLVARQPEDRGARVYRRGFWLDGADVRGVGAARRGVGIGLVYRARQPTLIAVEVARPRIHRRARRGRSLRLRGAAIVAELAELGIGPGDIGARHGCVDRRTGGVRD